MPDDLLISIDSDGAIASRDGRFQQWLRRRAGLWKLVPSTDDLLIFGREGDRQDEPDGAAGELMLTGDIESLGGLADIITFLNNSKRSGALVVLAKEVKKTLFFSNGDIRMATSNVPEERIGELLYRFGLVTREQLAEALNQQQGGRKLGRILIDEGVITAHQLYTTIRRQVEGIFYSSLLIRSGAFYVYNLGTERPLSGQISLNAKNLLLSGLQRIDEMSYFRQRIPSSLIVFELAVTAAPKRLSDNEKTVFELVDGKRTVESIGRESRLGEFEATKALFQLLQRGCVAQRRETDLTRVTWKGTKDEEPQAFADLIDSFNSVYRAIRLLVSEKGTTDDLFEAANSFLRDSVDYGPLFAAVEISEEGNLDAGTMLENLHQLPEVDRIRYLHDALEELLNLMMFAAGENPPADEAEALQSRLEAIFRTFAGRSAPRRNTPQI